MRLHKLIALTRTIKAACDGVKKRSVTKRERVSFRDVQSRSVKAFGSTVSQSTLRSAICTKNQGWTRSAMFLPSEMRKKKWNDDGNLRCLSKCQKTTKSSWAAVIPSFRMMTR